MNSQNRCAEYKTRMEIKAGEILREQIIPASVDVHVHVCYAERKKTLIQAIQEVLTSLCGV